MTVARPPARRLPWAPLDEFGLSCAEWAEAIGTTKRTVLRYKRDGIPERIADRVACRVLGRHPWFLWPDF